MNKAEKKFRLYAVIALFALLAILLGVINGINFTMAAQDADNLTAKISEQRGDFGSGFSEIKKDFLNPDKNISSKAQPPSNSQNTTSAENTVPDNSGNNGIGRFGPMGPTSPEMSESLRYFTISFSDDNKSKTVVFNISAITEDEAVEWASSLKNETTGWTHGTYRYRVYKSDGQTYVTVIDQGRELLSCYRILLISVIGGLIALVLCYIILKIIGRKLFEPLEKADRKQKEFLREVNKELRLPLTVIGGNTEIIEKTTGTNEQTQAIRRQVGKMTDIVDRLGNFSIFKENKVIEKVDVSKALLEAIDKKSSIYSEKNITVYKDIRENIFVSSDEKSIDILVNELIENSIKYALSNVTFKLSSEGERITLEARNDTSLPDGSYDQVFDRFTILENAKEGSTGLGLAYVKDIVKKSKGRLSAKTENGFFTVKIHF